MKVILAGTSGLIGQRVLHQCLLNPSISTLVVLSRRPLSQIAALDPERIKVLVLQDFRHYSPEILKELEGAKACIWTLGGSATNPTPKGKCLEVEVEFPLAAARALLSAVGGKEKIRFLFVSGILSVRDQNPGRKLWFQEEGRRARGLAECRLEELAAGSAGGLEVVVVKAGYVVPDGSWIPTWLVRVLGRWAVGVRELAAAMVEDAMSGKGSGELECRVLGVLGRRALVAGGGGKDG